jgi:hypothetical protein
MATHRTGTREEWLAAESISMSSRSADTKRMPQPRRGAALGAADFLCLAAAPTFAFMALLTGVLGGGAPDMLCSAGQDASPLSGMVPMYLLMSAVHSAPWLKWRGARCPSRGRGPPAYGDRCGADNKKGCR